MTRTLGMLRSSCVSSVEDGRTNLTVLACAMHDDFVIVHESECESAWYYHSARREAEEGMPDVNSSAAVADRSPTAFPVNTETSLTEA